MMRNVCITFLLLFICGCHSNKEETHQSGIRIVSLSPGITNTVIDAGFSDFLVGRSPFCFNAHQDIPIVGDLRSVDYERLLKIAPTHVFVQQTVSNIDEHLVALATQGKFKLHAWPIDRFADIQKMYGDLTEMFGDSRLPLELVSFNETTLPSPVLVITQGMEGNAGLSFGKDTYIDDLLEGMGVSNVLHQSGWISLSLEDISRLQPKAIIVVSDSEILERSLNGLRSIGIPVLPFVHEHVLVPSSYIVDVAEMFQKLTIES